MRKELPNNQDGGNDLDKNAAIERQMKLNYDKQQQQKRNRKVHEHEESKGQK